MTRVKTWTDPEIEAAREILARRLGMALHFKRLASKRSTTPAMMDQVASLPPPELVKWIDTELTADGRRDLLVALRMRKLRK
jgi:hypothetical protein